jgi:hypothetical protein
LDNYEDEAASFLKELPPITFDLQASDTAHTELETLPVASPEPRIRSFQPEMFVKLRQSNDSEQKLGTDRYRASQKLELPSGALPSSQLGTSHVRVPRDIEAGKIEKGTRARMENQRTQGWRYKDMRIQAIQLGKMDMTDGTRRSSYFL